MQPQPWPTTNNDFEHKWIELSISGDQQAYERLYRANVGRVYALVLRLCGRRDVADELTQEVFLLAWRKLEAFRGDSAFSTWLYRLATNLTISHLRKRSSWEQPEDDGDWLEDALVTKDHHGTRRDLEAGIRRLPDKARTVLVLHDLAGYQHDEIAQMMNTAVGTCKAQLHRARKLLRQWLTCE